MAFAEEEDEQPHQKGVERRAVTQILSCCTGKMKNLPCKVKVIGIIALRLPCYRPEKQDKEDAKNPADS